MLKILAAFAVTLAIMQAPAPTPGRTSTNPSGVGGNNKDASQGKQNPSAPPLRLDKKPIQAVAADPHGSDVASETADTEHSVKITTVPPITFATPITFADKHKPWTQWALDWGQWVFAGALAFVGWLQVGLLKRQEKILHGARKEIHTQARHMSRQADLMSRNNVITLATARAAKESAKAANAQIKVIKDRERPRMVVSVNRLKTLTFGGDGNQIIMRFENIGPTQAENVRATCTAQVVIRDFDPSEFAPLDPGPQEISPQEVFRANQPPVETYLIFFIPEKWGNDLVSMDRPILIEMRGTLEYKDIFGDRQTAELNYDMRVPKILNWRGTNVAVVHQMAQWRKVFLEGVNRTT